MDPRDFCHLAGRLASAPDAGAAHHRSAIGRAYYAAYNVAAELFESLGWPLAKSANGHEQAVQLLQASDDAALQEAGGILGDLRADRNRADYDLTRVDVEKASVARAKVELAADVISELDAFLRDEARKANVIPRIRARYRLITGKP